MNFWRVIDEDFFFEAGKSTKVFYHNSHISSTFSNNLCLISSILRLVIFKSYSIFEVHVECSFQISQLYEHS